METDEQGDKTEALMIGRLKAVNWSSFVASSALPQMLLVSGRIPVLFDNRPWGEPLRMEDDSLSIVIKQAELATEELL